MTREGPVGFWLQQPQLGRVVDPRPPGVSVESWAAAQGEVRDSDVSSHGDTKARGKAGTCRRQHRPERRGGVASPEHPTLVSPALGASSCWSFASASPHSGRGAATSGACGSVTRSQHAHRQESPGRHGSSSRPTQGAGAERAQAVQEGFSEEVAAVSLET